jgi:starch synthase (maltosyl-transferring)
MNFNWVFLNPVHLTGLSGSIYAVKDHYQLDPVLIDPGSKNGEAQLKEAIAAGRKLGLRFMIDLVVNHTAIDSPLVNEHPAWYQRNEDGSVRHPGAWDGPNWITWYDLAALDNTASTERAALWDYWDRLLAHYQGLGFTGFRCDAAYQVPQKLWRHLTQRAKARGEAVFFAETLGCSVEQTVSTARAGFDYIFNSFKWWDLAAPWFLEHYRLTHKVAPSVAFPESHDTERLYPNGGEAALMQRYSLAAAVSAGVLMPVGYEFGFRKRLHVVETTTADWEEPSCYLTEFIAQVNAAKGSCAIMNLDSPPRLVEQSNPDVVCLARQHEGERLLICINKDLKDEQGLRLNLDRLLGKEAELADLMRPGLEIPRQLDAWLAPGEVFLLHAAVGSRAGR